jgi:hypothetical protein
MDEVLGEEKFVAQIATKPLVAARQASISAV